MNQQEKLFDSNGLSWIMHRMAYTCLCFWGSQSIKIIFFVSMSTWLFWKFADLETFRTPILSCFCYLSPSGWSFVRFKLNTKWYWARVQVTLGYFIMLAAMSYNTWVFISIIVGMSLGNWAFGWTVKGNFAQKFYWDRLLYCCW